MKKLFALSLALVMTLSLAACGGKKTEAPADTENKTETETETPTTGDVKVAVVLKTLASEYWGYVETGCKAAAKDLGVDVVVVGPGAESDIEGQVSMIEQQIGAGCDAIVCAPNDAGAAQGALQAAIDAGIPVLAVDTNVGIAACALSWAAAWWTLLMRAASGRSRRVVGRPRALSSTVRKATTPPTCVWKAMRRPAPRLAWKFWPSCPATT